MVWDIVFAFKDATYWMENVFKELLAKPIRLVKLMVVANVIPA